MKWYTLLSVFLFFFEAIQSVELAITLPGTYQLGDFITTAPLGADTIITVSASDVTVDLGGMTISQTNGTLNVNGITVASGLSDVSIKNGVIRNVTGKGIVVDPSCTRIRINNMRIENCGAGALALTGSSGSGQITNFEISDCGIFGGHTQPTTTAALYLDNCFNGVLQNILIADIVTTVSLSCIESIGSENCIFTNVVVSNDTSTGSLQGFNFTKSEQFIFNSCQVLNCSSTISTCTAFLIESSAGMNFNNCAARQSAAQLNAFAGFSLISSTNNFFNDCASISNSGRGPIDGFVCSTGANQNVMTDCTVLANLATVGGASMIGFHGLNGANGNTLIRCLILYNQSVSANSTGILLEASAGSNWLFRDCQFNRNSGGTGSFGINDIPAAFTQLFFRNTAFNNGTVIANQIVGFPANAISTPAAPATSNINSITSPWTNGVITT